MVPNPGIADIIDDTRSVRQPTSAELHLEASTILSDITMQQQALEQADADRRAQLEALPKSEAQLAKMAARRAKAEQEEQRRKEAAAAATVHSLGSEEDLVHIASPSTTNDAAGPPPPPTPLAAYQVAVETSSVGHTYYDPSLSTYSTLDEARAADVWTFPATLADRARAGVFRALWERGYFMGTGIKFGGDLLVYPGAF